MASICTFCQVVGLAKYPFAISEIDFFNAIKCSYFSFYLSKYFKFSQELVASSRFQVLERRLQDTKWRYNVQCIAILNKIAPDICTMSKINVVLFWMYLMLVSWLRISWIQIPTLVLRNRYFIIRKIVEFDLNSQIFPDLCYFFKTWT